MEEQNANEGKKWRNKMQMKEKKTDKRNNHEPSLPFVPPVSP